MAKYQQNADYLRIMINYTTEIRRVVVETSCGVRRDTLQIKLQQANEKFFSSLVSIYIIIG